MARTCQICKKKIAFWDVDHKTQGMSMHFKCKEEFLEDPKKYGGQAPRELEDDAGKQKKRAEPKEEKSKGIVTEEDKQAGPWTIAKSITAGKADEHPIREPEGPKHF